MSRAGFHDEWQSGPPVIRAVAGTLVLRGKEEEDFHVRVFAYLLAAAAGAIQIAIGSGLAPA